MRKFTLLTAAAVLWIAAPASAQLAPPPKPIVTTIDHVPMVELYDGGGGLPYLGSSNSYNAGDWENALRTYHDNGTYVAQIAQIDAIADNVIKRATPRGWQAKLKRARATAAKRHHGRDHGQKLRRPAIVLDIDETSLSNYAGLEASGFTAAGSVGPAVAGTDTAIAPTLALFKDALQRKVAVFFVTGRPSAIQSITEANLRKVGYDNWKGLFEKPAGAGSKAFKSSTRAGLERKGYTILANVGDQESDLDGGHAARAFKLPNPFYFISD